MLILNQAEVQRLFPMEAAIETTSKAFINIASKKANIPQRHHLSVSSQGADMLVMSGLVGNEELLSVKIVSLFPENPSQGLPATIGSLMLVNNKTGKLEGIMDATYLTSVRTGAASAVATAALARPESSTLGILGAGSMSFHQTEAVLAVRSIERIFLYSRTLSKVETLVNQLQTLIKKYARSIEIIICKSAEELCRACDIICACTTSYEPVVRGEWLKPGTHINATGSFSPAMQEIDEQLVSKARIVTVDSKPAAFIPGDLAKPLVQGLIKEDEIVELGHVLTGTVEGRRSCEDFTLFKSVGTAAQDVLGGWYVYHEALAQKMGQEVELD
ncbi:MAG: ornithine cyclodeaminase family protein [Bacillota bacterium]